MIKQTFKYRDPRETKYLNRSQKDDLGRQRNHVLYGFDWKVNPGNRDQIILSKGAIYTQDGVKIFFDQETILPVITPVGNPDIRSDFPFPRNIIIGIRHNFVAATSSEEAKFVIIEVRTSKENQEPAYYIHEIDTIDLIPLDSELVDPDRPAYNGLYQNVPGGDPQTSLSKIVEQKNSFSIPENITPVIKIRIQQVYNGGTVDIPQYLFNGSGQLSPGVDIVRYKNIWNQVNDMIGVNIFEPVIEKDLNEIFDLNYPSDSRTSQEFVKNSNSPISLPVTEQGTPTLHPLYGSFDPSEPHNFAPYRFASFLLDGRSLLEGMKRLDAWLRLLVNRTGEQTLISESLIELKDIVDKGLNGDPIIYGSPDFMLKSGTVFHKESSNVADTHKKAIHLLDNCVKYIADRLGMTPMMTRGEIDGTDPIIPELWDLDNPPGRDLTENLNFHDAIQRLRDHFTSRGNDIITGTHVYSLDESDRDAVPAGQKTVVKLDEIKITDDTDVTVVHKDYVSIADVNESNVNTKNLHTITSDNALIKVQTQDLTHSSNIDPTEVSTNGPSSAARINKSGFVEIYNGDTQAKMRVVTGDHARTDSVDGNDVAALDANSRYRINRIGSYDGAKAAAGQGPVIEGVINAPQNSLRIGALVNHLEIDPRWSNEQLQAWAGTNDVAMSPNGTIYLVGGFYHYLGPFQSSINNTIYLFFEIDLYATLNGAFKFGIVFYNSAFQGQNGVELLNVSVNGLYKGNPTVNNPGNHPYFRYYIKNEGTNPANVILRAGCNYSTSPILSGTPNTDLDSGETLVRKDYTFEVCSRLQLKSRPLVFDSDPYSPYPFPWGTYLAIPDESPTIKDFENNTVNKMGTDLSVCFPPSTYGNFGQIMDTALGINTGLNYHAYCNHHENAGGNHDAAAWLMIRAVQKIDDNHLRIKASYQYDRSPDGLWFNSARLDNWETDGKYCRELGTPQGVFGYVCGGGGSGLYPGIDMKIERLTPVSFYGGTIKVQVYKITFEVFKWGGGGGLNAANANMNNIPFTKNITPGQSLYVGF